MLPEIIYRQVSSPDEVEQILALQALNHSSALDPQTKADQGFLTVRHEPEVLLRMNRFYPSVIAHSGEALAGYCLVMPRDFALDIPVLAPMFEVLEALHWKGKALNDFRWFVMGQVCVATEFRGRGVFDGLYRTLRQVCQADFDLVVTEISDRNMRSLRAHQRVGFQTMHTYFDAGTNDHWVVVGMELVG